MRANVYIVSAPSGSGKTTLLQSLLQDIQGPEIFGIPYDASASSGRAEWCRLFLHGEVAVS